MRIAILCNTKSSEYPNRPELIDALTESGAKVFFGAIYDGEINSYYNDGNAEFLPIEASRNNTNPLKELVSLFSIRKAIKQNEIDSVIVYGVKNHSAMAIGAKLGGANNILCVVNGKGNLFKLSGLKGFVLRTISFPMLKISYGISKLVCFQNKDDSEVFINKKLVRADKVFHTCGSGVNTELFPKSNIPEENRFLYLARITPSKGMTEFVSAARIVKEKYKDAMFDVVGPIDETIEGSCKEILEEAEKNGIVSYHGATNDVSGWMKKCRFFIYPSYYPEGMPRCVLQAMSTGRPIITCNSSGCRETVFDGENGFLVPPKDVECLAEKMIWMIENKTDTENMAEKSRELAENIFDVNIINNIILSKLGLKQKSILQKG